MKCPICDEKNIANRIEKVEARIPSGEYFFYDEKIYTCDRCGFKGPINNKSYASYEKNRKLAIRKTIKSLVGELHKTFVNLLYIERALDLPRRTLSRWKNSGESSTSSLLLLKMVQTFPFLLSVAENKFEPKFAEEALRNAVKKSHMPLVYNRIVSAHFNASSPMDYEQAVNIPTLPGITVNMKDYSREN